MLTKILVAMYENMGSASHTLKHLVGVGVDTKQIGLAGNVGSIHPSVEEITSMTDMMPNLGIYQLNGIGSVMLGGILELGALSDVRHSLILMGIDDDYSEAYAEALRRGDFIVFVACTIEAAHMVAHVLCTYQPIDFDKRIASWVERGWLGFDPLSMPLNSTEIMQAKRDIHYYDPLYSRKQCVKTFDVAGYQAWLKPDHALHFKEIR